MYFFVRIKVIPILTLVLMCLITSVTALSQEDEKEYPALPDSVLTAELLRTDGSVFKLSDLRGKAVLVNLWGIWCGPCRADMPDLVELQKEFGEKGFEVLGVNLGDDQGMPEWLWDIQKFGKQMGLNYPLARSSDEFTRSLYQLTHASVVPQSILIDSKGRLRGVFMGYGPNIAKVRRDTVKTALPTH
jgi:thiol-disulfide isomerase/thioredoxin